jgi:hypothetical protein
MIPVGPSRPSYWRALFVAVISGFFVVLSIHSMCHGSFRMRGHAADVTSVSDPVLFWGFLGFMLLAGAVGLYAAFRDVRFLVRRRRRKS